MSPLTIIILLGIVVFVTHALEAVTGFGCTVLAFPFVIAITGDIGYTKIILSILAWLLALYFAITKFKNINWKQFLIISTLAGVGLPAGMLIFKSMDAVFLTKLLGGFIILSASIQLYKIYSPNVVMQSSFSFLNYLYLIAGGVVHGAFATGGPLIVLYSTKKITNKGEFRATMCLLWACLNSILIIQFLFDKKLTEKVTLELIQLLPFLLAGIIIGEIIHSRINEDLFRKIVFFMLFFVGLVMVII